MSKHFTQGNLNIENVTFTNTSKKQARPLNKYNDLIYVFKVCLVYGATIKKWFFL